ncbi:MAG: SulP family inorganic anion transporter [Myxococcaceae bacterium]
MNKNELVSDLRSGFLISLIALPLCLGVSMASGCPPIAGVITAMVAGLVSSFLGSSRLTIKGPAAGLIVIIVGAVYELGQGDMILGYQRCLAVGVAAAILQIILSQLNVGRFGKLMPPSVIHGMLAAIGIIIMAKQIHVLLGVVPISKTPFALIAELPTSILQANPLVLLMGLITLLIITCSFIKKIPPTLVALTIVVPVAFYLKLDSEFLVALPKSFWASFSFPDFSALASFTGIKYVFILTLVGSLESLLTVIALDKDSDLNKDLFSVGVGNLIASLLGGLPMISEVVRSKANVDAGAKTHWSNFFHGAFLLIFVTLLTPVIQLIPLAALAAMLLVTGFRLASPQEFYKTYKQGIDQFCIFTVTCLITLKVDILVGVAVGILLTYLLSLSRSLAKN